MEQTAPVPGQETDPLKQANAVLRRALLLLRDAKQHATCASAERHLHQAIALLHAATDLVDMAASDHAC